MIIKLSKRACSVRSGRAHIGCLKRKLHASKRGAQGTRRDSELSSSEVLHNKGNFPTSPRCEDCDRVSGELPKPSRPLLPAPGTRVQIA